MAERDPIRVLVAVSDRRRRSEIVQAVLASRNMIIVGETDSSEDLLSRVAELLPEMVIVGQNLKPKGGIAALEELSVGNPTPAILVADEEDVETVRAAMVAGARDFFSGPAQNGTLVPAIERIVMLERRRKARTGGVKPSSSGVVSQVIVVVGAKGGIGRSVISVNLATALSSVGEGRVALFDMNMQFADTHLMLNLTPKRSLADIGRLDEEIDEELLSYYLTPHDSGLQLLLAALTPQPYDLLPRGQIASIIGQLRQQFHFVVIDAPGIMGDALFGALSAADQVLLVTTPEDLPTLRDSRLLLETIADVWGNTERVGVVANRLSRSNPLTIADISKTIGAPIVARIPEDATLIRGSVNHGIPFVLTNPSAGASMEMKRLAEVYISRAQPRKAEDSGQSRWPLGIRGLLGASRGDK